MKRKTLWIVIVINLALLINLAVQWGREDTEANLQYIVDLYEQGESSDALDYIDYYLAEHPEDHVAWTIKGNILTGIDCIEEAEEAYLIALDIEPYNYQAINALGILSRRAGEYDDARLLCEKAVELNPDYALALTSLATIELKQTNDVEALRLARLAFEKKPNDATIVANLAVACHYNDLPTERDEYTQMARTLEYPDVATLDLIYSGKVSVRGDF